MNFLKKLLGKAPETNIVPLIQEGALLVDVRTAGEYNAGHVKDSVNIPLDHLETELSALTHQKNIIVFCQSGGRSRMAKKLLEQYGFSNVVDGKTWKQVEAGLAQG
ncbi:Rhodanese-related sulfurtransferase [Filimonas lacunae]|uniref:Rhodanese-related sulfurtransferase n=1 Tax=Filimonas lacunae TaxID=477680 RepID=A0A173MDB0_9BACT|nr:rhodanese-like domain-containing protein [Filimonas lacunae]BAV05469.1 phage shock protein E [Filimonas lacunae]SIT20933.1 Rhodanese-related sulfurtransferase [Filimonas lacunae]